MYKNIYVPRTYIDTAFLYGHNVLRLPLLLHNSIIAQLDEGDWTYLGLYNGYAVEIVKVVGYIPGAVIVLRAQDSTDEGSFAPGSWVYSTPTAAAVLDTVNPPTLSINYSGSINSSELTDYKITIPKPTVDGLPFISVKPAYGCCHA